MDEFVRLVFVERNLRDKISEYTELSKVKQNGRKLCFAWKEETEFLKEQLSSVIQEQKKYLGR